MAKWPAYSATRFKYIGTTQCGPKLWRFVCLDWEGGGTSKDAPAVIGPLFQSKAEMMGALEGYGRQNYPEPA